MGRSNLPLYSTSTGPVYKMVMGLFGTTDLEELPLLITREPGLWLYVLWLKAFLFSARKLVSKTCGTHNLSQNLLKSEASSKNYYACMALPQNLSHQEAPSSPKYSSQVNDSVSKIYYTHMLCLKTLLHFACSTTKHSAQNAKHSK